MSSNIIYGIDTNSGNQPSAIGAEGDKLKTLSTTQTIAEDRVNKGKGWILHFPSVALNNANTSNYVMYLENTGTKNLVISQVYLGLTQSITNAATRETATSSDINFITDVRINFWRNIDAQVDGTNGWSYASSTVHLENLNHGSEEAPSVTALVGGTSATISGGAVEFCMIEHCGYPTTQLKDRSIILPKGKNICVSFKTPLGNSDMDVTISMDLYEEE